jgi:hypothetical protein
MERDCVVNIIKTVTPWKVTVMGRSDRKIYVIVLPNIVIEIRNKTKKYLLRVGKLSIKYKIGSEHHLIARVKCLIQSEIERLRFLNVEIDRLQRSVRLLELQVESLKLSNKKTKNKMKKQSKCIMEALTFHPNGVEANLLKEDFEKLVLIDK